jgi:hypothetical protein
MTSSSPTTPPDLPGEEVRLRHQVAEPNGLHGILMVAVLVITFGGAFVYWLRTGSGTVGDGGTVSNIGGLVWFGPLFLWVVVYFFIGDRGPFAALYLPRSTIDVRDDGISWTTPKGTDRWDWDAIGGISCLGDGTGQATTVFDPSGVELGSIAGPFADQRTKRAVRLPDLILERRLDLFEAVDARNPGNGCVRRQTPS